MTAGAHLASGGNRSSGFYVKSADTSQGEGGGDVSKGLVMLLVGLVFVFAACGDGSSTTTQAPPETQPATTSMPPPSTTTSTTPATTTTTTTTSTLPPEGFVGVDVYFAAGDGSDCSQVAAFPREIPASIDPILAALQGLVGGPTADEVAAGAGSFFSEVTADAVRSVDLSGGLLVVDLVDYRAELNNASTSCGSASLIAQLNATVFQFDEVERARYTIFGSCGAFYEWLQSECQDQTRTGSVPVDLDTNEEASGSGCTPGTEQLPDGEWFGYVTQAEPEDVLFDLACWFSGIAAADAAAEDGEESPPPNDYYIRNESDVTRIVPVDPGATVDQLVFSGPDTTSVAYDEWAEGWSSRDFQPGIWITITDGAVTTIVEQYQP